MIKKGSEGEAVRRVQILVKAPVKNGIFCARTEAAVKQFQRRHRLGHDGIVGPATWSALVDEAVSTGQDGAIWPRVSIERVELPKSATLEALIESKVSYGYVRTGGQLAAALRIIIAALDGSGAVLTTSGGMRSLRAKSSSTRSTTSMHYVARAIDLGVYTGGVNPARDPLIVVADPALAARRRFRVYARASNAAHPLVRQRKVSALSLNAGRFVSLTALLVDITALFEERGLSSIGARSLAWDEPATKKGFKGLEWWHFQDVRGLEAGATTFGDELLHVHGVERAQGSSVWEKAGEFYGVGFR